MICFTYIYEKTSSHNVDTTYNLKYIVFGGLPPPPKHARLLAWLAVSGGTFDAPGDME